MRPHNKSTLWDEYVEHPDKNKKYFNTKHKKAFCKRCIAKAVDDLDRSPDARVQFETTGFVEGWPEWKYRAAFDMVEALSGRSSNMQRHIRTCEYISPGDRARIMANFEASQAASRASKDHDPVDDNYSRLPGTVPEPPISPSQYGKSAGQPCTISHSDDDGTSSSSISSPEMGRNELFARPVSLASSASRPSRRLTLRSILNEDSETPSYPYSSSVSKERAVTAASSATTHGYDVAPVSPDLAADQAHGLLAKLDLAIDEIQHVRNRLEGHIGLHGGQPLRSSEERTAMITWLRKSLDDAHRENDWLKRRFSSMKADNRELKARLETVGEKLRHIEAESRRILISGVGNDEFRMVPRSNSAPALTPQVEPEALKKWNIADGIDSFNN